MLTKRPRIYSFTSMQGHLRELKAKLYVHLDNMIKERHAQLSEQIASVKASKQEQTKSSAGDKHETSRALLQTEEDQYKQQLAKNLELLQQLKLIVAIKPSESVSLGSIVKTNNGIFLLSIGVGNIKYEGKNYYVISPKSPLGKVLIHKKVNEQFEFMGKTYQIEEIG